MKHVETYTDIPTILSIKINEDIGYITNVYFRINETKIGKVNWVSRFQAEDNSWYSVFSTEYVFSSTCKNQRLDFVYEVEGSHYFTEPIIFDVEIFYDCLKGKGY